MPQIPTYEGFQVSSDRLPFSPFSVADMPDIAGSQTHMMSESLSGLSDATRSIALQVIQEINETVTRKNDREFAEGIRGVLHDSENGFLTLLGINAMTGREPAMLSLEKAYQTMEDRISDPVQRRMFVEAASRRLETARLQIDIHAAQQTRHFKESETSASVTSHAMDAVLNLESWEQPASPYSLNKEAMLENFDDLARMRGYGEVQATLQKQSLLSSLHGDIVNRLIDQNNPQQAKTYLEAYTKEIQPDQIENIKELVDLANLKNDSSALSQLLTGSYTEQQEALTTFVDNGDISPDLYQATRERIGYRETVRKAAEEKNRAKARDEAREWVRENPTTPLFEMPFKFHAPIDSTGQTEELEQYREALANPQSVKTDWKTFHSLNQMSVENREGFANLNLEDYRTSISQAQMDDLAFMQEKAKDPKQSLGQAELMNQIGRMAKSLGFNEAVVDQTGFDEERGRLTSAVMHAVREEEIQKGHPLGFEERQKVIQRTAVANHEELTKKQRDGHPEDRKALERKANVGGIVVPNTAEIYRNGVDAATTVGSTIRGFLAELWNSGAVDTGQMAFEGAVRASPFGPLIAIAEAVTGENLLEPFTRYTDGAKVEMTPDMRLGGSLAEILPMGILSKAKKGRNIANAIKNEKVANLPKHTTGKNSITGGTLTDKQHKTAQTAKTESDTLLTREKSKVSEESKPAEKAESANNKNKNTSKGSTENFHLKVDDGENGIISTISTEGIIEFAIVANETSLS